MLKSKLTLTILV